MSWLQAIFNYPPREKKGEYHSKILILLLVSKRGAGSKMFNGKKKLLNESVEFWFNTTYVKYFSGDPEMVPTSFFEANVAIIKH